MRDKKLKGGVHAEVKLLLNGLVEKRYSHKMEKNYFHEKKILVDLKNKKFEHCPIIKQFDDVKRTIWMTYCGDKARDNKQNRKAFKELKRKIKEETGWYFDEGNVFKRIIFKFREPNYIHNVCQDKTGRLHLIDFGSFSWKKKK